MITRPIIRSIVRSIKSPLTGLVSEITTKMLTFDGATSYGELAEPWISTDANATESIEFVALGTDYNLTNEIAVVSGALSMDAGITSALLDGVSIGITGAIPNDGKLHTLLVGGTFNTTHIASNSVPNNFFNGIVNKITLTRDTGSWIIHTLGDSFATDSFNYNIYRNILSGDTIVTTLDGVGGSALAAQKIRFDSTPEYYGDLLIIMDGGLDDSSSAAITAINAMVSNLTTTKWVYVQPSPGGAIEGSPERDDWNTRVSAIIADVGAAHYVECLTALQDGNDGSTEDLQDVADNIVPRSLKLDSIHESAAGTAIRTKSIVDFLYESEWITDEGPKADIYTIDSNSDEYESEDNTALGSDLVLLENFLPTTGFEVVDDTIVIGDTASQYASFIDHDGVEKGKYYLTSWTYTGTDRVGIRVGDEHNVYQYEGTYSAFNLASQTTRITVMVRDLTVNGIVSNFTVRELPLALIYNNVALTDWNDYISLSTVNGYDHWFKSDATKMTVQVTATSPDPIIITQRTATDDIITYASDTNKTVFGNAVGGVDLVTNIDKVENEELHLGISVDVSLFYCYGNQLTGSIPDLSGNTVLSISYFNTNQLTGSIPDLSANTVLSNFQCYSNQLTGSIPNLSANIALKFFYCHDNQLTGSIPDLSANTVLSNFSCRTNQLTGSIPNLSANTALELFYCYGNQLTDYTPSTIASSVTSFNASDNALTQTAIDQILADCDTAVLGTGFTLNLGGGTNAAPSAAGLLSKANLEGRGATVTVNT